MLLEKVLDDVKPQLLDTNTVPELSMDDNNTNPGILINNCISLTLYMLTMYGAPTELSRLFGLS